jgi:hypothetical protein
MTRSSWDDRDSNPHALSSGRISHHYSFRYRVHVSGPDCALTVHFERKLQMFRPRPSSLYTFPFAIEQAWLGVVSEEFADFERIPQGVSDPAAQGFYPKSAVSASSTIIADDVYC